MPYKTLIFNKDADIGTLTLNRPRQKNALTRDMGREIHDLVIKIKADPGIRVLIITGAGNAFSSGGDLQMLEKSRCVSGFENKNYYRDFYPLFLSILKLEIPVIAAINGHAVGAGLCLALACDIRCIAEEAMVGMNFTKLGIHPGMGGTYLLPRIVGIEKAHELFFTARLLNGTEARDIGLASRVFPYTELMAGVRSLAEEIAVNAPIAVKMVKKALRQSMEATLESQLEYESFCQGMTFSSEDFREGIKSVKEKRPPRFTGR